MLIRSIGKNPSGKHLQKIQKSANYTGSGFHNLVPTEVTLKDASYIQMMRDFLNKPASSVPSQLIPAIKTDLRNLPSDQLVLVWFGHSSYLLSCQGTTILVDPVLNGQASPVAFFGKPFKSTFTYLASDLPPIDLVIITHDHYDHLDYQTITALDVSRIKFYTPLGVGSHLAYWGVPAENITELDWWESIAIDTHLQLTATPARHFSGRGLVRNKTLWASFVLQFFQYRLMLGGDSGYGEHFTQIGSTYGPFNLAILEAGQYGKDWPYIHMFPEETVQAAVDLKASRLLPVHWGKFTLAYHSWNEPIQRVLKQAEKRHLPVFVPQIGKPLLLNMPEAEDNWWQL